MSCTYKQSGGGRTHFLYWNPMTRGRSQTVTYLSRLVGLDHAQVAAGQGKAGQQRAPSKGMCVYPKCKPLQDLKSAVAALVLNGVLELARGDGEVLSIVDHAC